MGKPLKKAYLEITNICNLDCSFCHKTKREKAFMSKESFTYAAKELFTVSDYLYFHVMGEPLLHPQLEDFLKISADIGFKTILTTNGTTLCEKREILLSNERLYKVSISLHSFEANDGRAPDMGKYLDECFEFARDAAKSGVICVLRLWNLNGRNTEGENKLNPEILTRMRRFFGDEWAETRSGMRLCDKVFLEFAERFDWPDPDTAQKADADGDFFCHGLRDQIGILCDGTVVPCCLDSEGRMPLGNIFDSDLEAVLSTERAQDFYKSVSARRCPSETCRSCGYAMRFSKKNFRKA